MSKALLDQVDLHRREIKHEVITYGLSELIAMHRAGDIKIRPEYQRMFRWDRDQQSLFIESILLEIPFPPIFFFENEKGVWELLDGLQRMSTIVKFMGTNDDVPEAFAGPDLNEEDWHRETQNDINAPLQLRETDYLHALKGFSFARLPTALQLNMKRARMQIYVLKRETHPSYKYEVFKRLNTGGETLSDQEVRNCATRLFDDRFPDYLQELAKNVDFRRAIALDDEELRRARAEELALRFLTMKNAHGIFKHDVSELLTDYMKRVAEGSQVFDYDEELATFNRTWKVIAQSSQDGAIFRPLRGGMFAPTAFEIVSLAVAFNIDHAEGLAPDALSERLVQLLADAKSDGLTGAGSNSKKKTIGRVERARAGLGPL